MEAIKIDPTSLEYASVDIKDDRDSILEFVKIHGSVLRYASDRLKDDKEIAMLAIKDNHNMIRCVSDRLKNDSEVVLSAFDEQLEFTQNSHSQYILGEFSWHIYHILKETSDELKNNQEFIDKLVKKLGMNILSVNINVDTLVKQGINPESIKKALEKINEEKIYEKYNRLMNLDYTEYNSIRDIIAAKRDDVDDYILDVVDLCLSGMSVKKEYDNPTYVDSFNVLRTEHYNSAVRTIYYLVEAIVNKGEEVKFGLWGCDEDSTNRYEEFRKKLHELTGISKECFSSAQFREMKLADYLLDMAMANELSKQKSLIVIGKDKSYYQRDLNELISYKREVENKQKYLHK